MGEPDVVVEVKGLTFGWDHRPVLEDVDLVMRRSDFLAVIGPNGGGKTTLVRLLLGLLKPWKGEIRWHLRRRAGGIGYVPQRATFDPQFPATVRDVVLMGRLARRGRWRRYGPADVAAAERAMERLGLSALGAAAIGEVSGGQLQRALIARAVAGEPEILILDEPTAWVDAESRERMSELLSELHASMPIVVVTHDVTSIAAQVRQFACVNGRLFYHGDGVLSHEALEEVYGCPVELIGHDVPHRLLPGAGGEDP